MALGNDRRGLVMPGWKDEARAASIASKQNDPDWGARMAARGRDQLAADLVGLCRHLADTLVRCEGCGNLVDGDAPCPECARRWSALLDTVRLRDGTLTTSRCRRIDETGSA